MADDTPSSQRVKLTINIVTLLALAALGIALRRQIMDTLYSLDDVNFWLLLLMVPLQFINYHSYARMYQHLFRTLDKRLNYWYLFKVQLELNFVNNVFPSGGLSGYSYFSLRLRDSRVGAGKATLVQAMKYGLIFVSFQILIFAGLFCLAAVGNTNDMTILVSACLGTLLMVITFGGVFIVSSKQRINSFFTYLSRGINRFIGIFRPKHPETINIAQVESVFTEMHENFMHLRREWRQLKKPLLYALLANTTEIATIYIVYLAFGWAVNPGAVIIAYAIANFAGLVSVLPGGVGIYEAIMTAVLATAGVRPALSLPVTVMYRILNMTIQLPPGYYFYHQALHAKKVPKPDA